MTTHFILRLPISSKVTVHTDAAEDIGGSNAGVRPMELLLMGLASCSAIDVALILKKQRQDVRDFRISVEGERVEEEGTKRKPFRKIHLHFDSPVKTLTRRK